MNHLRKSEKGFTLVELLVVIIIIGILAAIAIPVFLNQRQRANEASLKSDIRTTALAMEDWYIGGRTNAQMTFVTAHQYVYVRTPAGGWPHGNAAMPGLEIGQLSKDSKIGVKITGNDGFCVIGAHPNSKYNYESDHSASDWYGRMLFWDSLDGGLKTRTQLTEDGACAYFAE